MKNQRFKDLKRLTVFLLSISTVMIVSTLFIPVDKKEDILFISFLAILLMISGFISLFLMIKTKK